MLHCQQIYINIELQRVVMVENIEISIISDKITRRQVRVPKSHSGFQQHNIHSLRALWERPVTTMSFLRGSGLFGQTA